MSKQLVIYHDKCSDGIGAAWVFKKVYPDAEFYPILAGSNNPPDVNGKDVFMVDCAYPKETLLEMKKNANSLLVLDHHKSNMEKLSELDFCMFDMKKSGMGLAWDYLFPNVKRHWLVDYTEDKDLWRWTMPDSREINSAIQSYPLEFLTLYRLETLDSSDLLAEGKAILRANQQLVRSIVDKAQEIEVQGYKVLCVNTPVLQSEVAGYLAKNRPFGIAWFENEKGEKVFSLRSKIETGGVDVSVIASKYPGGGGHKSSAGFRLVAGHSLD